MKNRSKATVCSMMAMIFALSPGMGFAGRPAFGSADLSEKQEENEMTVKNLSGPSGVPLGGAGVGYYEIDPTGRLTRNCINNIHKSFVDSPDGFLVGVYDGQKAARLQRDSVESYGMKGYADSSYTGLWPTVSIDFDGGDSGVCGMGFSAYSGVIAHDVKDSSLPVVYYEVELKNESDEARQMSAILTWGDLIGRGIRDTSVANPSNLDGESSEWKDMDLPATYAKGAKIGGYTGVLQYAEDPIIPQKATFQNYNNNFLILAEDGQDCEVSILKSFKVGDGNALSDYVRTGKLSEYDEQAVPLSAAKAGGSRKTESASAVSVMTTVPAGQSKTLRFAVSWFMPEITEEQMASIHKMEGCDYNKYYHNFFSDIFSLTDYAISRREAVREGIDAWQRPLLESSLPDWLIFKEINSGYTLYTNGVLNKRGNFSTLEGEMGGYGGTMDQKMSSHPFYEKLFPSLNLQENLQFANVTGSHGEIQHFDVHYYHGMSDSDPENRVNPTPAGSMTDNTGAWMVQIWNDSRQTGDLSLLSEYGDLMQTSMAFLKTKYAPGTHIPNYNTTYDDYTHPEILIYSGTVWLTMLDIAADWADALGDAEAAKGYRDDYAACLDEVQLLYGDHAAGLGFSPYYAFGSDADYISSKGESGNIRSEVMFSGAMAGQFISRYSGRGDILPFEQFASHMDAFLHSSVQGSNDYYAPKVYNLRTGQDMDNSGSRCWPFYLDSYGGMAAIQAGYLEDGLEILYHTMLVHRNLGYMWSQNLWNPAYATYMTAPVCWFVNDVLAGSALDVPGRTLTLGPSCPASEGIGVGDGLQVTLYYPKYWATVDYRPGDGVFLYQIIQTFYEEGESPIEIDRVIASPAGVAADGAQTIQLKNTFVIREGEALDLSEHLTAFTGQVREKQLTPVDGYVTPGEEKIASGSGLSATVESGEGQTYAFTAEEVNFRFTRDDPPAEGVTGGYTLRLDGRILPHYGQKYQLIFEYTGEKGDLELTFDGKAVTDASDSRDAVESQQFTPTEGCRLLVYTVDLKADTFYRIGIAYKGDLSRGDNVLRFLWWSSTQNMGLVIKERLYPLLRADSWINGQDFSVATARIEGDHMAYTEKNTYAIYSDVDFGSQPKKYRLEINAGAPSSDLSKGGKMEIRLNHNRGKLLGSLDFTPTGDWDRYRQFTVELNTALSGSQTICLVFKPDSTFLFNYTTFRFASVDFDPESPPDSTGSTGEPTLPATTEAVGSGADDGSDAASGFPTLPVLAGVGAALLVGAAVLIFVKIIRKKQEGS